jgi:hypothetical protein
MQRLGPARAVHEFAAAIGAEVVERFGAFGAEGAFEAADEGTGRFGREIPAAALAIGTHFQHFAQFLFTRLARRAAIARATRNTQSPRHAQAGRAAEPA